MSTLPTPVTTKPGAPSPDESRRGRGKTVIVVGIVVLALAAAGWALVLRGKGSGADPAGAEGARAGAGGDRAVSVLTKPVTVRDVPVLLEGIGSVVALKTVTVKSQVDGRLDRALFEEGKNVRKGEVLAQIDPRPFAIRRAQAEATLARDKAQLRSARLTLERYETVRKENLIAQQQLDEQRATVEQLEATIQSDETQVEQAKLQLDYARIKSPIDGVTGVRLVDPGNIVRATDPTGIVVVAQLDPIAVLFTLPQDDLPRIATQMAKGPLRVELYSRDGQTSLGEGELALIDNQINQTTASIRLKAVLPNPKRTLWPNQFVKARLLLTVRKQALVLPATAIQRGPKGTFVYVVGADQKAESRPVKIDGIEGEIAILSEGVAVGDEVVIEGQAQLRPGSRVMQRKASKDSEGKSGEGKSGEGKSGEGKSGEGKLGEGKGRGHGKGGKRDVGQAEAVPP